LRLRAGPRSLGIPAGFFRACILDYRSGKCSQCGAEYKVPASFAHNVARCKVCRGVVHLSPSSAAARRAESVASSGAPAPAIPARKVTPRPADSAAPAAPRRSAPVEPARERGQPPERREELVTASAAPAPSRREAPESAGRSGQSQRPSRETPSPASTRPAASRARAARAEKKTSKVGIAAGAALLAVIAALFLFRERIFGPAQASDAPTLETPSAVEPPPDGTPEPAPGEPRDPPDRSGDQR
jgi:hypothetical protein